MSSPYGHGDSIPPHSHRPVLNAREHPVIVTLLVVVVALLLIGAVATFIGRPRAGVGGSPEALEVSGQAR